MPLYEYKREDGTTFEVRQRMGEPPLEFCPETGQKVKKLFYVQGIRTRDTGRKITRIREKENAEQNLYTTDPYYKPYVEKFKDENKIPTYKNPKIVSYAK